MNQHSVCKAQIGQMASRAMRCDTINDSTTGKYATPTFHDNPARQCTATAPWSVLLMSTGNPCVPVKLMQAQREWQLRAENRIDR